MHTLSPRRKAYDRTLRTLLYICAGITCALLFVISTSLVLMVSTGV